MYYIFCCLSLKKNNQECRRNHRKITEPSKWCASMGIRSLVRQLYSPTARQLDSLVGNMNMTCVEFLNFFYFQINGENIEIHTVQRDSNNVSIYSIFIFSQSYAKVSDYRAVGLSSRKTIDTHSLTWLKYCRYGVKLYPINQSIYQTFHGTAVCESR